MAKKKKHRGNYCKICDRIIANERFSGKGHSNHVCKECSKLPLEERNEKIELNRIYSLYRYWNLSKANKKMLQNYLNSKYEKVRIAAKEMLDEYSEIAKFERLDEECAELIGIDTGNDEFLDDDEDDDYIMDLHNIDGRIEYDPIYDDELPF